MKWKRTSDYLIGNHGKHKIDRKNSYAMFDLDGTLIKPSSGARFPKNKDDWEFMPNVEDVLSKYTETETHVLIVTNQSKLKTDQQIEDFQYKIEKIIDSLKMNSLVIYVSISNSKYRKPCTAFWDEFLHVINKKKIFYCGDACGRKGDHADTDYKFSHNIGIKFYTPEHVFLKEPNNIGKIIYPDLESIKIGKYDFHTKSKDFTIITGMPGSGKSYFCDEYLSDYTVISRDNLKTLKKCLDATKTSLENKEKIVIDNTNPSKEARIDFINIAKKYNRKIRSIYFNTDKNISKHNNIYRSVLTDRKIVPDIAYRVYAKQFCKPSKDEGFDELIETDFQLDSKISDYFKYFY